MIILMCICDNETGTSKNVNNCLNTNIYSCFERCGGQSSNLYLNVVLFFNTSVYYASGAVKIAVFPQRYLICAVLLTKNNVKDTWTQI